MDRRIDPGFLPLDQVIFGLRGAEPAKKPSKPATPATPGRGTFFDEHIDMCDPEGAELTARALELCDLATPRLRKRSIDAQSKHTIRIRKLLANALRCHFFREISSVLYFRKADAEAYENKPKWMRHGALGKVVDALLDAGLITTVTGKLMPYYSDTASWTSSYMPTQKLTTMSADCGVTALSIEQRLASEDLIQLYAPKPKRQFDVTSGKLLTSRKGKLIRFTPTAETQDWTATLEAINTFYRQQAIALGLSSDELALWLKVRNADPERRGTPYRLPEMFKDQIYRVFNNGAEHEATFDNGGRLFGGWWMSVSKTLREAITINGEPTVELDYSSCHPRMLYHEKGIEYADDLYCLPEMAAYEEAKGAEPGTYRPYIKWLFQVLINCRGRPQFAEKASELLVPEDLSIDDVIGYIEANHHPIIDSFNTGAGMRLMKMESEIALDVISSAMAEGWPVLSVHDSFIAAVDNMEPLKTIMVKSYFRKLGMRPEIN